MAAVSSDIDGDSRHASTPDIGADEFTLLVNDIGLLQVTNPVIAFDVDTQDIEIKLINNGSNVIDSVTINWSINGLIQAPVTFYGPLFSGVISSPFKLGEQYFALGGEYDLLIWSTNPNGTSDANTSNDTIDAPDLMAGLNF